MTHRAKISLLAILLTAVFIGLVYCFEVFLAYSQWSRVQKHLSQFGITESREDAAKRLGAKVSVNCKWYFALNATPPDNYPIATWPSSKMIGYKEGDGSEWPLHTTDRFGYFNDDAWWVSPYAVIVGDSFVTCEHLQTNSITKAFRRHGIPAVNVGITGSGPLVSLAALKAQWPIISNSVRVIIWTVYDGNDYQDAMEEWSVPKFREALHSTPSPNPSLLASLPKNDQALYGWKYAVWSVLSLKRTRLVFRSFSGMDPGVRVWNDCISEAEKMCPNIILVRIPKIGFEQQKSWSQLKARHKVEMPAYPELFSNGWVLSHLNHSGYERMVEIVLDYVR